MRPSQAPSGNGYRRSWVPPVAGLTHHRVNSTRVAAFEASDGGAHVCTPRDLGHLKEEETLEV